MYTFLIIAFLFTLLLDPAAAASPVIDPVLPAPPMESFYSNPHGILSTLCEFCFNALECCSCSSAYPHRPPVFTAATFLDHPDWPQDDIEPDAASPEPEQESEPEPEPESLLESDTHPFNRTWSFDEVVQYINDNATAVQTSTVQVHIETTYTPGDRTLGQEGKPKRPSTKRQAPRPGGFPCTVDGCDKAFNRSCDLKRHQKTHQPRSERPHKCSVCNEGFLYPKDRNRHQKIHVQSPSSKATLYCRLPNCTNVDGFSRRDNLLRHQRNQHADPVVV